MANSSISIICKLILDGAETAKKSLKLLQGGMTSLAAAAFKLKLAVKAVGVAIGATKNVVYDTTGTFEKESSVLASVLSQTRKQISSLTMSARQLGRDTVYTANEVVQLQTALSRLGFSEDEIKNMEGPVLRFAAAVSTDLPSASAFAGAALRAFGMDSSRMGELLDIMSASTTKSALDFEKLQESISVVAPVTHAFGLDAAETASLLGVLANSGFRAESAAIAIRNIFTDLANSSGKIATAMGRPVRTFDDLLSVLSELKARGASLDELYKMTNKRAVAAMSVLVQNVDQLKSLDDALKDASGTMNTMYATATDNIVDKVKILKSAWEELKLTIGNTSFFEGAIDTLSEGLNHLSARLKSGKPGNQGVLSDEYYSKLTSGAITYEKEMARLIKESSAIQTNVNAGGTGFAELSLLAEQRRALDDANRRYLRSQRVQEYRAMAPEQRDALRKELQTQLDVMKEGYAEMSETKSEFESNFFEEQPSGGRVPIFFHDLSRPKQDLDDIQAKLDDLDAAENVTAETAAAVDDVMDDAGDGLDNHAEKLKGVAKQYENIQKEIANTIAYYDLIGRQYNESAVRVAILSKGLETAAKSYGTASDEVKNLYAQLVKAKTQRDSAEQLPALSGMSGKAYSLSEGLKGAPATKVHLEVSGEDKIEAAATAVGSLASSLNEVASAADGTAGEWLKFASTLITSSLKLIATIVALTGATESENASLFTQAILGSAASAAKVPYVGAALALAAIASVSAALVSIPQYAQGGLAYGATVGMFGEYPGARTNPEVVGPLSDLRKFFKPAEGVGGEVRFRIEGHDLMGVLVKTNDLMRRS